MKKKLLTLNITGLSLGFSFGNRTMYERVQKRYEGYIHQNEPLVLVLDCRFSGAFKGRFQKAKVIREGNRLTITRRDFFCKCESHEGEARMRPSIYAFDACLRILLATLLPRYGGLLVHASGLAKGKKAYVFAGVSGSGKTTVSRLYRGRVLNDEIVGIKSGGKSGIRVYGTPFWGEMGTGPFFEERFKLESLFFLKKSKTNLKIALPMETALTKLLRCCCYFSRDPTGVREVFHTAVKLLENVPAYELHFTLSEEFLRLIA